MPRSAKYLEAAAWIRERILSGQLRPGDRVESENELSGIFGLSRQTARHALETLVQQGMLERVRGSGTYVREGAGTHRKKERLSDTITIVSTYVDSYIFPRILQSMIKILEEAGFGVKVMLTNNQLETERRLLMRHLEEDSRDPLIVEPVMSGLPSPNVQYYRQIWEKGIPVLFFHSYYPELSIPHISMDDVKAGRAAAEYLISQGHREIGGIFKRDDGQGPRRYKGFLEAVCQAGIPIREERICWFDTQELKDGLEKNPLILKRLSGCTACVCYNDQVGHILTGMCRQAGIQVPEDLSIVSFDNSELAKLNSVPLTSIAHPMERLGEKTAKAMLRMIQDSWEDVTYEFVPEMEIRSSVFPFSNSNP
ncbi:MAG TPA: GntR family transcriptional regulator [Candidatus Choladousia intestinavium]|uniref:GntR family transcriptional regulator n=1 Tax=Candidatus Choladousia intestinavium TaxID=2840727 RepID=A0A9D1AC60_9FIRM|nr:GntR family transcriptional regulator [Candidatus Choladousia intestinavium]